MGIPSFPNPDTSLPKLPSSPAIKLRPIRFDTFTYEPSSRHVRAVAADSTCVVDSRHNLLVWEPNAIIPDYAFPSSHVRTDLLVRAPNTDAAKAYWRPKAAGEWYDFVLPSGQIVPCAAWKWKDVGLDDYWGLSWHSSTPLTWYEEDDVVHSHARGTHWRVDTAPSSRHVVVRNKANGDVLADSKNHVALFETCLPTRFYIPRSDVKLDKLEHVSRTTTCPYKGYCEDYWRIKDGKKNEFVAWSYANPMETVGRIKGLIAFDSALVDLIVDGEPFVGPKDWA